MNQPFPLFPNLFIVQGNRRPNMRFCFVLPGDMFVLSIPDSLVQPAIVQADHGEWFDIIQVDGQEMQQTVIHLPVNRAKQCHDFYCMADLRYALQCPRSTALWHCRYHAWQSSCPRHRHLSDTKVVPDGEQYTWGSLAFLREFFLVPVRHKEHFSRVRDKSYCAHDFLCLTVAEATP